MNEDGERVLTEEQFDEAVTKWVVSGGIEAKRFRKGKGNAKPSEWAKMKLFAKQRYANNREKFAFMSKAWLEANLAICYLTEQHRQEGGELDQILNEIRSNSISPSSLELLKKAENTTFEAGWEPQFKSG